MSWKIAIAAALVLAASATLAAPGDAQLRAGAAHFRSGRYAEALVQLKAAERLGAGAQARYYVGATLVKLERYDEALEAFLDATARAPAAKDALLAYYEALASHGARLYRRADALFAAIGAEAGPRIAEQARRAREELATVLKTVPKDGTVDWYLTRAEELARAGRAGVAALYAEEALALGRLQPSCHRCAEAERLARPPPPEVRPSGPR